MRLGVTSRQSFDCVQQAIDRLKKLIDLAVGIVDCPNYRWSSLIRRPPSSGQPSKSAMMASKTQRRGTLNCCKLPTIYLSFQETGIHRDGTRSRHSGGVFGRSIVPAVGFWGMSLLQPCSRHRRTKGLSVRGGHFESRKWIGAVSISIGLRRKGPECDTLS